MQSSRRGGARSRSGLALCFWLLWMAAAAAFGPTSLAAAEKAAARPKIHVRGLGLVGNRRAEIWLRRLVSGEAAGGALGAAQIEDAALLLLHETARQGFLRARLDVRLRTPEGAERSFVGWTQATVELPPEARAREVWFRLKRGVRFHYRKVEFSGLHFLKRSAALGFFYPTGSLLAPAAERPYHPETFRKAMRNLQRRLRDEGFREATVSAAALQVDEASGNVDAAIRVVEGPRYYARKIRVREEGSEGAPASEREEAVSPGTVLTAAWESAALERLRAAAYREGYPEASAEARLEPVARGEGRCEADLAVTLRRGRRIRLGEIRLSGNRKTRESLLRRRAALSGPWLDRLAVDKARERLIRLGVFKAVEARYEERTNRVWDVGFHLKEVPAAEARLLFGYGSYDLAFGGVELSQNNVFGLAHAARLRLIQSFRSTSARYAYTAPEVFRPGLTAFATVEGLRREEVTFDREEFKCSVGLRQSFPSVRQSAGLRYSQEILRSEASPRAERTGRRRAGAFILDWAYDGRDRPLSPRKGARVFLSTEWAQPEFGGEAAYQRVEVGFSAHAPLAPGLFLHCSLWHGAAGSFLSGNADGLPFNKRFFPGGDTTLRGYQRGEASPMDARGRQLGAESVVIGNLELEKAVTRRWSAAVFLDYGGMAAQLEDYPIAESLWCAGVGLRWNTPVGPVRLEYGRNLNPRPGDPGGTVHFSVGAPF